MKAKIAESKAKAKVEHQKLVKAKAKADSISKMIQKGQK
jgi:hypothetical protein